MVAPETPHRIEPCLLTHPSGPIVDLVAQLSAAAQQLAKGIHPYTAASLARLVRVMNCYYSNLIEGHNTTPREIEQAFSTPIPDSSERRHLLLEAKAHIRIQGWIDDLYAAGALPDAASRAFILQLHEAFYADAPPELLRVEGHNRMIDMQPGQFRSRPEEDVSVGRHIPPASDRVDVFMQYFEQKYSFAALGPGQRIIAMACAHHRFNYIHPFPDGNGRVSRLMSHAMGLQAGIGAHGLWSISRGLARGLNSRQDYKQMMDHADSPRISDIDGRGNLSQKALEDFVIWFLQVALDQIQFMESLFKLETLSDRLKRYADITAMRPEAYYLLEATLLKGQIPRGEAPRICGLKERSTRTLLSELLAEGLLASDTPKGPVHLNFPVKSVDVLFPQLFPET